MRKILKETKMTPQEFYDVKKIISKMQQIGQKDVLVVSPSSV